MLVIAMIFSYVTPAGEALDLKKLPADDAAQTAVPADKPAGAAEPVAPTAPAEPVAEAENPAAEDEDTNAPGNITVNFKGADIRTVLAYIAEVSGVDIVPAPDVKGIVDLKLTNKPWKTALDLILRNYGFAYEREGDIIRVVTVTNLKQEELSTQVFNLNYGNSKDVVESIKDSVSERGKLMFNERTNAIIVTDIPTNIYKIGQIIERLDDKTPQVLIEARVIETVLDDDERLGIDWNVKFSASGAKRPTTIPFFNWNMPWPSMSDETTMFPLGQVQNNNVATATQGGTTTTTSTNLADYPNSPGGGTFGFPFVAKDQFTFGTLDFSEFKAVLEFIKSRANTDVVSNPRIATVNNREALINVGNTLNLPTYERNSTTGKMEITGYEAKDLGIILKVTPHINQKDEIVVDLAPEISDLLRYDTLDAASGVVAPVFSTRQAKTQVMIKDGDTIFIGGLIKENDIKVVKKLPFVGDLLGDVPYVGLLFSKKETIKRKTELIFFVTVNLIKTGKGIKDVPTPDKVFVPSYTLTQEAAAIDKKRAKKKNR
jgi:type IV pilus assembly protein PilQ